MQRSAPVVALTIAVLAHAARAQLTPDREYFGVGRPIPMRVAVPPDAQGEARLELFEFGNDTPLTRAPVVAGGVNLASVFPSLWEKKSPAVRFAQLVVGETRVGPPVVLRPMVNPPIPMLYDAEAGKPWFIDPATGKANDADARRARVVLTPDEAPCYTGLHAAVEKHVVLETSLGPVEFRMRYDQAPNTVDNFLRLVEGGFYTDIPVHRVVAKTRTGDPFVVQFGDPSGTGDGGPGYNIDLEPSSLPHDFGVLSMARNTDPNTNGSQVFICLSREGTARLDGKYTAFAQAVSGAQVILDLAAVPCSPGTDRPENPPMILSAHTIDAPPFGQGPTPVTRPETPPKAAPR